MSPDGDGAARGAVLIIHSGLVVGFAGLEKSSRISGLYSHRRATNSVLVLQLPKENIGYDSQLKPVAREGEGESFRSM